jgi:hypothetical protein
MMGRFRFQAGSRSLASWFSRRAVEAGKKSQSSFYYPRL